MVKIREKLGKMVAKFSYISIAACFFIMAITTFDVIVRKTGIFNIKGSNELVEMGMVVMVFLGIASLQVKDGHVRVDMLVMNFPQRIQHLLQFVMLLIEVMIYGSMSYACIVKFFEYMETPVRTGVLEIPYTPFYVIMIVGLVSFTILLLMDSIIQLIYGINNKKSDSTLNSNQDAESSQIQAI